MQPLPINEKPYYNTDASANTIAANAMYDCYLEPVPGVGLVTRRRPGLVLFCDLGTASPGQGLYWWDAKQKLLAVSDGKIYEVSSSGTATQLTGITLNDGTPVIFAAGQSLDSTPWLYMANGILAYTLNATSATKPADSNAPPATHVAWINGRFVANNPNTNQFYFTDTNPDTGLIENDYWSSTDNPVTCEARGDNLNALLTAWQEIYAWGSEGLQIFQDDGVTPFSNIPGAFAEIGIEAVYSIVRADNTIFALCVVDDKRVVIKFTNRTPQIVSEPIARILADMAAVSDANGCLINCGGLAIYLLNFPSANQSWAYDYKNDTWSRWGNYNGDAEERNMFIGQFSTYAKDWGKHLIMSRVDGKIYELSRSAFDDAGTLCIPYRQTGWTDCGAPGQRKQCSSLYVTAKANVSDTSRIMLRWRDDGAQGWSEYMELTFYGSSVEPLNRMGTFRTRQYEFRIPAGEDTILISSAGEFKELAN